jgi:hypothetical protein
MATKKKSGGRVAAAKRTTKSSDAPMMPKRIYAQASPHSIGGVSMFDARNQINAETFTSFFSEEALIARSVALLQEAGLEILQVSPSTINFAGTQKQIEEAFATTLVVEQREVIKPGGEALAEFIECPTTDQPGFISTRGSRFAELLEGVAIEEPRYWFAPSMYPPTKAYWHLDVPAGVSLGCNADKAHRSGITGKGITVAMVDSGHFKHPYFAGRGYRVAPVTLGPAAANPLADESGHGTAESANIFAVAPDVDLKPVKINFVNSIGGFNTAVGLMPRIITCSWGSDKQNPPLSAADTALAAAIAAAVASGIVVIFSAGNGHFGFPGQHPDVISAGGVYMDRDESLRASNYSSGFASSIYPGRNVPDLSGLVGLLPRAAYVMLPLQPGDDIDTSLAGGTHPNGDETAANDGWAAISGTSAAAPQLAGAAALVLQACSKLTPAQVKQVLRDGARDVTAGNCFNRPGMNHPATAGTDLATGTGLVDAQKSVLLAKVKCLGPIVPISPITIQPVKPVQPVQPITIQPVKPIVPIQPIQPIQPITVGPKPPQPIVAPVVNPGPVAPAPADVASEAPEQSALSQEDVDALQDLIIRSDVELGE